VTDPLEIRAYRAGDRDGVVALWRACDLTRPWNDPDADIALFGRDGNASILLGIRNGRIVATAAVGHDGHRGWLYYVAVDPVSRGVGYGRAIVRAAESWLADRGIPKVQLMIRNNNAAVAGFYAALGFETAPIIVMQRWLKETPA
jgi:ribosomal protein S18 acetylase RimI-like enzyme